MAVHPTLSEVTLYEETGKEKSLSNIYKSRTQNSVSYQVVCRSLDYLMSSEHIDQVDFLKMNIEGTEHELLEKQ